MGNKLKMKDIITLAIFNVAILVVMVVVKMVIRWLRHRQFNYLAYVGVMALFCAPLYGCYVKQSSKNRNSLCNRIIFWSYDVAFWFWLVSDC